MTISNLVHFANANFDSPHREKEPGNVCIPNISLKERQVRKRFAVRQFVITLAILGVLIVFDVNPLWRLALFFMFSAATTSYIQALDKT